MAVGRGRRGDQLGAQPPQLGDQRVLLRGSAAQRAIAAVEEGELGGAQELGGALGLALPLGGRSARARLTAGEVEDPDPAARAGELGERRAAAELDVVRVGADREDVDGAHRRGLYRAGNGVALPRHPGRPRPVLLGQNAALRGEFRMTRRRTTPGAWLRREMPFLFARRRKRRDPEDGPPDPARWLDQLDRWLERKLPPPRGPLAELAVFAVRLAIGRGSWVVGALLVAMSAPFFVFPYRQAETMVKAAWYRAAATGRAEARVERAGVRLLPVMDEGGLRGEPYVILAFEPTPGRTLRVRYLPHGAGLESFNQAWLDSGLLVSPPAWASGWRFRWADPATGEPAIEVNVNPDDLAFVNLPSAWNGETYYDNAVTDLDLPLDWLMAEWRRRPGDDLTLPVRFPPGHPERIFVGDTLSRLPPTLGSGWGELFGSCVIALPFGLPFWWFGTRLLAAPLPRRWRHVLFWGPLALLPLWGTRYLEVVERLSPGSSSNVLVR